MRPNVIIIGTSEFSEYVFKCIEKDDVAKIVAFAVNKQYIKDGNFNGLPVVPIEELSKKYDMSKHSILITIGYHHMNQGRAKMYHFCKEKGYKLFTYLSPRAFIDCDLNDIGEGNIVMPRASLSPATKIGVCNVFNSRSVIGHTSVVGDFNWFAGNVSTGGDVQIGNSCFFGMSSLVSNNVTIADETFLGICSYVTKDTKPGLAYMGMPAKNTKNMKSIVVVDFV